MITQGSYEFLAQDRVIYGVPAAKAVVDTARSMEARRVFLVTNQPLNRNTDVIDKIRMQLGDRFCGLFDECVDHVPRASVLKAADAVRRAEPDLIVTVGGGTPIDTVKILLLCLAEDLHSADALDEYRIRVLEDGSTHMPPSGKPPLRQIVVPTTLSGAEFSCLGGCTDPVRQIKDLYTAREIGAQAVILDPRVTVHTPEWLWLSTGVRAIDHAVESICSRNPQPFTDATCLHGLKLLHEYLPRVRRDAGDLEARLQCQIGVWLASTGLGRIEWGASHGIGHQLGAVAGVAHGHTSCVMLHNVMRYNLPVNRARQVLISQALGRADAEAADLIEELVRELGMPTRLSEVGVMRDHFAAIAEGGMTNMMVRSNPRPIVSVSDIVGILEQAW